MADKMAFVAAIVLLVILLCALFGPALLGEAGEADGMNWVEAIAKADESGFEKIRLGFVGADLRAMELFDNFGQTTLIRFSRRSR